MLKIGCIADDFTGATDLANNLVRSGMRVVQAIGVPAGGGGEADGSADAQVDAVVIALKSRTVPAKEAIKQSLEALRWLQSKGAQQIYFKYCSTFDSTAEGNIGPVTEALMDALGCEVSLSSPAFPDNQRTVFKGYLFVGNGLLNESGMQNHPLTPMADANLVRVMQSQCQRKVGLVDYAVVARGAVAISLRLQALKAEGVVIAIVDAVSNDDLHRVGAALKGAPLIAGGSGMAIGLAQNFGILPSSAASSLPQAEGLRAVISGSCSLATNRQVAHFAATGGQAMAVDPLRIAAGADVTSEVLDWARSALPKGTVLVYSTADADGVKASQQQLGVQEAGALVEQSLAAIATGLVGLGVRQLVVAGGETSGACVQALGVGKMRIGFQIDPGVPWCHAACAAPNSEGTQAAIHLALKSGNFGSDDFFTKAFEMLGKDGA